MRRRIRSALLLWAVCLLLVSLCGCSKPKNPEITPVKAEVTDVRPLGMTIEVVLDVYNPNGFALTAQKVVSTVILAEEVELGPVEVDKKLKLPAEESTKLTVEIDTSWSNVARIAKLAGRSAKIPYEVKGTVTIGGKKLNVDLPFTMNDEVSRFQLLKAGMKGLPKLPGLPF